jgi:deferrochelatase/peroxidase EfeB
VGLRGQVDLLSTGGTDPSQEQLDGRALQRTTGRRDGQRPDTDDGLLFLAFMADPRRQFTPLMQRLAAHDALHRHTRHVGSALFAVPPGATPGSFIAQPLF